MGALLACNLYRKPLATLGTTALDYQTTVLARHAHQKTVGTLTGCIARLECSFHGSAPNNMKYAA